MYCAFIRYYNKYRINAGDKTANIPPGGGTTWSRSFGLVRFQIFLITALNSAFASSMLPSDFMCNEVRTTANSVALNSTVPSLFKGIFMETSLCNYIKHILSTSNSLITRLINVSQRIFYIARTTKMRDHDQVYWALTNYTNYTKKCIKCLTLHATRCGQSLPNPRGGDIFLNNVTTSRCFILPLASGSYSLHSLINSSK